MVKNKIEKRTMKKELKIPEIAENVETGIVAAVLLSAGDKVDEDQAVIELETDKATADIPSSYTGTIDEILVKEGDEVKVGQTFAVVELAEEKGEGEKEEEEEPKEEKAPKAEQQEEKQEEEEPPKDEKQDSDTPEPEDMSDVPAAPSVRRLAREKDIDLLKVKGSGPGGRILKEDIEKLDAGGKDKAAAPEQAKKAKTSLPDFSKWGNISREPMNNIRRVTAESMGQAWTSIPHVTQFDEADITDLEAFRQKNKAAYEKQGGKLTVTALLLKVATFALQRFPRFNSSIDIENQEIIQKHYYNIGVAVDTEKGLLVPVIKNSERKSLLDLAKELGEMAQKARDKKLGLDEMQGGNFTISNLGGIGGTGFTPIVYAPQVAILGVSESQYKQVYKDGEFQKRLIMPLSLSYDHRVIDGAEGARFLRWICNSLADPFTLLQ
jgi:pyruvate dehydrogenase E2 component (dihydrolipoamide acetyltransferase)